MASSYGIETEAGTERGFHEAKALLGWWRAGNGCRGRDRSGYFTSTSVARAQEVGSASSDSRLQKGLPLPAGRMDFTFNLEGTASEIGYQHGFLLAPEICRCARSHQAFRYAPDAARLGIFSQDGRARCFGRTLTPSISRSAGHCRWREGAWRRPGCV